MGSAAHAWRSEQDEEERKTKKMGRMRRAASSIRRRMGGWVSIGDFIHTDFGIRRCVADGLHHTGSTQNGRTTNQFLRDFLCITT